MRKTFLYGFFSVAVLAVVFLLISGHRRTSPNGQASPPFGGGGTATAPNSTTVGSAGSAASATGSSPAQSPASSSGAETVATQAGELVAATDSAGNLAPTIVLRNVRHAVQQYGTMFGGNPVGLNSEITAALAGQNPKHINFIDQSAGMQMNAAGELVDPWGTPYFFHQLSGSDMEIHSAGPDRVMWTADDLVIR